VRRPWRTVATALFVLVVVAGGVAGNRLLAVSDEAKESLRLYTELLGVAHDRYGADVTFRDLVFASIQGMLRSLDPHTNFLSPQAFASMREKQQASFYGLGILVGTRNGRLTVITPIEGTPAWRLGVRAGDVIQKIEGEPTEKMTVDEAVSKLKGPKDTQVHITLVRVGLDEPLDITVTRAEIPQTTVRYAYMIAPGTGYISISDFSRSTGGEVAKAMEKLRGQGMQRLILDLRNNGGGLLDQAIDTADQFLPKGSSIVETRGRTRDSQQSYGAAGDHPPLEVPLVVLVNGGTASAAEILSGAIQDHDMGLVVGTSTWGKGLVQTVYNLSYGAGLALTTAKYYTPSGRLIQRDYSSYYDYYVRNDDADGEPKPTENPKKAAGETFKTDLGRDVFGGGGITPDVEVETPDIAPFLQFLFARAAFFNFAVEYANRHPAIDRSWRPDAAVLDEFEKWVIAKKIDTADDVAKGFEEAEHRAIALRQIRADVFTSRFGIEASHQALAEGDVQIQKALALFPQASDLLARRKATPPAPAVEAAGRGRN
jgi:carboxyl-terminal processing protease